MLLGLMVVVIPASLAGEPVAYKESPLIGVVSEPCLPGVCGPPSDPADTSYIAASYVKFIESAGGRAVALVYNDNRCQDRDREGYRERA